RQLLGKKFEGNAPAKAKIFRLIHDAQFRLPRASARCGNARWSDRSRVQDSPLHAMSMVGPEKHQVNERARSGFELAAHWTCDYSALPRLETERKRAPERSDSFFYVLKSAMC